jgi:hypothetical protein
VLALKPSHAWWARAAEVNWAAGVAAAAPWGGPEAPGGWVAVERTFRDGHAETWWALEAAAGPYGPDRPQRLVVATPDPATLPERATWYLTTTLPRRDAEVAAVVRLYGLRNWVEQEYKQVKHALGWSQYQVRSDRAIRRHWALVQCAFAFCWADAARPAAPPPAADRTPTSSEAAVGEGPAGGKPAGPRRPGRGPGAVGRWRCAASGRGWSRRSCCGGGGAPGPTGRRRPRCRRCSTGSARATRSPPTIAPDPRQQSTVSSRRPLHFRATRHAE